jgi:Pentapeptide repeats (8 copies)
VIEIRSRWTGAVMYSVDLPSLRVAVEGLVLQRADLGDAKLRGADLRNADLGDADLRNADLRNADLGDADLRNADLRNADLGNADLGDADLRNADLRGADLGDAKLRGADLRDAKLSGGSILSTGETLRQYIDEVVPALLTAGGHTVTEVAAAWECHRWDNCPMAVAFDAHGLLGVPLLYRPRAEQFIQLFDARLIPCPVQQHV